MLLLLVVVVLMYRQLPDETGWVLDGFPLTLTQAVLLEKAVSGYDATVGHNGLLSSHDTSVDAKKHMRKSQLVADPRPPPPPPPHTSGLDAVIVFELDDEQCLLRAAELQR